MQQAHPQLHHNTFLFYSINYWQHFSVLQFNRHWNGMEWLPYMQRLSFKKMFEWSHNFFQRCMLSVEVKLLLELRGELWCHILHEQLYERVHVEGGDPLQQLLLQVFLQQVDLHNSQEYYNEIGLSLHPWLLDRAVKMKDDVVKSEIFLKGRVYST